jgi:hypothetical protein
VLNEDADNGSEDLVGVVLLDVSRDGTKIELLLINNEKLVREFLGKGEGTLIEMTGGAVAHNDDKRNVIVGNFERTVEELTGVDRAGMNHCISISQQQAVE